MCAKMTFIKYRNLFQDQQNKNPGYYHTVSCVASHFWQGQLSILWRKTTQIPPRLLSSCLLSVSIQANLSFRFHNSSSAKHSTINLFTYCGDSQRQQSRAQSIYTEYGKQNTTTIKQTNKHSTEASRIKNGDDISRILFQYDWNRRTNCGIEKENINC